MTSAETAQAAILDAPGAAFRIAPVPRPAPRLGQVLVRIAASAVHPLHIKIRAGQAAHARQPLPAILGIDLAGTIEAVGDGVTGAFRATPQGWWTLARSSPRPTWIPGIFAQSSVGDAYGAVEASDGSGKIVVDIG